MGLLDVRDATYRSIPDLHTSQGRKASRSWFSERRISDRPPGEKLGSSCG